MQCTADERSCGCGFSPEPSDRHQRRAAQLPRGAAGPRPGWPYLPPRSRFAAAAPWPASAPRQFTHQYRAVSGCPVEYTLSSKIVIVGPCVRTSRARRLGRTGETWGRQHPEDVPGRTPVRSQKTAGRPDARAAAQVLAAALRRPVCCVAQSGQSRRRFDRWVQLGRERPSGGPGVFTKRTVSPSSRRRHFADDPHFDARPAI